MGAVLLGHSPGSLRRGERGFKEIANLLVPHARDFSKLSCPGAFCSDSTGYVEVGRPFSGINRLARIQLCSKCAPLNPLTLVLQP